MFTIYSSHNCGWCTQAKKLLDVRKLEYKEKVIDSGQVPRVPGTEYIYLKDLERILPGISSVPQIYHEVNGVSKHIGGFRDLEKYLSVQ